MVVWISSSEKLSRFVGAIVLLWNILTRPALDLEFSPQDAKNVKTREFLVFTTEFQLSNISHSQQIYGPSVVHSFERGVLLPSYLYFAGIEANFCQIKKHLVLRP